MHVRKVLSFFFTALDIVMTLLVSLRAISLKRTDPASDPAKELNHALL
jgi:hypothetical protein